MRIPMEIYNLLLDNPSGNGYIPQEGLSKEELKKLEDINNEYKKLYETGLISFT